MRGWTEAGLLQEERLSALREMSTAEANEVLTKEANMRRQFVLHFC